MVLFISEVSSNHFQNLERCLKFVDVSANSGCGAVKFQLFRIDQLFDHEIIAVRKDLQERRRWELPLDFLKPISLRCRERGIMFGCTPFYLDAVSELAPYVDFYKVASYELLWEDLLAACARTGKPVILSTGMATMDEVRHAVFILKRNGCTNPTLLHCTSAYPTPYTQANLAAIQTIRQETGCDCGWSDHTVDPGVIFRAVHRWGASVVEFHLDLDGEGDEYSKGHCWLPHQIASVIRDVQHGLAADGDGVKEPIDAELDEREWRADPEDGLRPLKSMRLKFLSE